MKALTDVDTPLLLFLERIAEISISTEASGEKPYRRTLTRRSNVITERNGPFDPWINQIDVGDGLRFLVFRKAIPKDRVRSAVERSIPSAPPLKRWLDWKGEPIVSVAVSVSKSAALKGRLFNFLPMGAEASCPFLGYLDAPFFTDIDRRKANLELPLNKMLMEVAAELCIERARLTGC